MAKLTKSQVYALRMLSLGDNSAYRMSVNLGTLNALSLKGMVNIVAAPGNMAFPRTATWRITESGRAALKETLG